MIVTFYSFKGGVGRSFAVVETAVQLARRGHSVVVWDLDLEAPGLQRMPALGALDDKLRTGTVDLLTEFQREYIFPDELLRDAPVEFEHPALAGTGGALSFLLPGRLDPAAKGDESYAARFNRVDWAKLFAPEIGTGSVFFQGLGARLEQELGYEFVLVDARTGLTDLGAIAAVYLPDLVVLVSNLNEQNLHGVAGVYRTVTATKGRSGSGHLRALLVANMVPRSDPLWSDDRQRAFEAERQRRVDWLRDTLHVELFLELPLRAERLLLERIPSLEGLTHEAAEWAPLVDEIEAQQRTLAAAAEQ